LCPQFRPTPHGLTIEEIARRLGVHAGPGPERCITQISTDSRTLNKSELFVALCGGQFDGHRFVAAAAEKGAAAAVVQDGKELPGLHGAFPLIRVPDTQKALEELGNLCRHRSKARFLAITGSNGKTTTKTFTACLLARFGAVSSSPESFNNSIGVPLTIFSAGKDDRWVVLEMGTNHFGEIADLVAIAEPEVGAVTNIGDTHLEFLESRDGVARAKAELVTGLPRDGIAVLNAGDPFTPFLRSQSRADQTISFGLNGDADVFATDIEGTPDASTFRLNGSNAARLNVPGRYNLLNALAATALGLACGLPLGDMADAIQDFELPKLRMQVEQVGRVTIVLDAYNANPTSMRCALDTFDQWPTPERRILVLGEMKELGEASEGSHQALGEEVAARNFDILFTVGPGAEHLHRSASRCGVASERLFHCETTDEAALELSQRIRHGDTLFVKGSRSLALERISESIRETCGKGVTVG